MFRNTTWKYHEIYTAIIPPFSSPTIADMVDDIRAPAAWRRPKTKIYDYNQDLGSAYYKVTSHTIIFYSGLLPMKAGNLPARIF